MGGGARRRARPRLPGQSPITSPLPCLAPRSSRRAHSDPLPQRAGGGAGGPAGRNEKADAILLAPPSGVAVIFEAKVLSSVSTRVAFNLARNLLARSIDD